MRVQEPQLRNLTRARKCVCTGTTAEEFNPGENVSGLCVFFAPSEPLFTHSHHTLTCGC